MMMMMSRLDKDGTSIYLMTVDSNWVLNSSWKVSGASELTRPTLPQSARTDVDVGDTN